MALTEEGHRAALRVIRHHRLLELYLTEALGFPWDLVDAEAERLEHVISDEMESRIDAALGYPTTDPHGHPIPQRDGTLPEEDLVCLDSVEAGARVAIRRVSDADPELLRYLGGLGLYPGTTVNVCAHVPFGGPIHLQVDGRDITSAANRPPNLCLPARRGNAVALTTGWSAGNEERRRRAAARGERGESRESTCGR